MCRPVEQEGVRSLSLSQYTFLYVCLFPCIRINCACVWDPFFFFFEEDVFEILICHYLFFQYLYQNLKRMKYEREMLEKIAKFDSLSFSLPTHTHSHRPYTQKPKS